MKAHRILILSILLLTVFATGASAREYKDVRYAPAREDNAQFGPSSDRLMDIYIPDTPKPSKGYPVVMFVHGGGFMEGNRFREKHVYIKLVERGFAVVAIDYEQTLYQNRDWSLYREAKAVAIEDASLALEWIWRNAKEYGFDRRKVSLFGGSAGAMTIMDITYIVRPRKPRIRAVVDLWGEMDDVSVIRRKDPPIMVIHGDKDDITPVEKAYEIQRRIEELGRTDCRFIILKDRRHAQYRYVAANHIDDIATFLRDSGGQ